MTVLGYLLISPASYFFQNSSAGSLLSNVGLMNFRLFIRRSTSIPCHLVLLSKVISSKVIHSKGEQGRRTRVVVGQNHASASCSLASRPPVTLQQMFAVSQVETGRCDLAA